jgi:propanediol dehydratase small subunit
MKDGPELAIYPLAENAPEQIRSGRGKALDELTIDAVLSGDVTIEDLRITPEALKAQAEIARRAGRPSLAANFERGAELVSVPQDLIMETYELLRPGRANSRKILLDRAEMFRRDYGAEQIALFLEMAAEQYHRRRIIGD